MFADNSTGREALSLVKSNGGALVALTTDNSSNVQWNKLSSSITNGKVYSEKTNTGKGQYVPKKGGAYSKTATNTGNLLLIGFGLMAVSGVLLMKRRKALKA